MVKEHLENSAKRSQHTYWPQTRPSQWSRAWPQEAPPAPTAALALPHPTSASSSSPAGAPQGVGREPSGVSRAAHDTEGGDVISSGWTLLASHSHAVTISRSRRGLRQLSFDPAPPGMSQPHPPQQCSPRWKTVSAGCAPRLPHQPGDDLGRQRGEDTAGNGIRGTRG